MLELLHLNLLLGLSDRRHVHRVLLLGLCREGRLELRLERVIRLWARLLEQGLLLVHHRVWALRLDRGEHLLRRLDSLGVQLSLLNRTADSCWVSLILAGLRLRCRRCRV